MRVWACARACVLAIVQLVPCVREHTYGNMRTYMHTHTRVDVSMNLLCCAAGALKFINKGAMGTVGDVERVMSEILFLKSLVHSAVISLLDVIDTERYVRVCVYVCVRAWPCVCVCARARVDVCVRVLGRVCVLA